LRTDVNENFMIASRRVEWRMTLQPS
jgi:hypothetical protein